MSSARFPPDAAETSPRRRRLRARVLVIALLASVAGCRAPEQDELLVFAAASLHEALTEVGAAFEANTGATTTFNFAGSNVLARQLLAAPRADVFVSAHPRWIDELAKADAMVTSTRRTVLSNALVVVGAAESDGALTRLDELATLPFRHLALGDPAAVPAGIYARAALLATRLPGGDNLWSRLADRVIPTPDVRAAIALVAAQPETLGIVYRSDVHARDDVRTLLTVPAAATPEIRYEAVALASSDRPRLAARFVNHLTSPAADAILARHGFTRPPSTTVVAR